LSQFATLSATIDRSCKLLKIKAFIYQKSLDTPVFGLIRFRQKVLTGFSPPLELFSLEGKAALLPGGLFVFIEPGKSGLPISEKRQKLVPIYANAGPDRTLIVA
jgi:hypothetical protein